MTQASIFLATLLCTVSGRRSSFSTATLTHCKVQKYDKLLKSFLILDNINRIDRQICHIFNLPPLDRSLESLLLGSILSHHMAEKRKRSKVIFLEDAQTITDTHLQTKTLSEN